MDLNKYRPSSKDDSAVYKKNIEKWLLSVVLHDLKPTIWIICTHADANHDDEFISSHIRCWTKKMCEKFMHDLKDNRNHEDVLKSLDENLKIFMLTNTYSFKGHPELNKALESLSLDSVSPGLSNEVLPVEWEDAMDRLHKHSEQQLNASELPVIFRPSEEFKKLMIPADSNFLEYYHNIGEVYFIKSPSSSEMTIILNLDWMINLLKGIYHHSFNDELDKIRCTSESKHLRDLIRDAPSNKQELGIISESILKKLWKCTANDKLFNEIIELFVKFNLTYLVPRSIELAETSYFFPHLKTGKFCAKNYNYSDNSHITVTYTFSYFIPHFFLQRLALEYWKEKGDTLCQKSIFEDGFETVFKNGTILHVTHMMTDLMNAEKVKIFVFGKRTLDGLWSTIPPILNCIHLILSSYWKISGQNEVFAVCPQCVMKSSNGDSKDIPLLRFEEEESYFEFCSKKFYCEQCKTCSDVSHILPPPSSTKVSDSEKCFKSDDYEIIAEGDFAAYIKRCGWELVNKQLPIEETVEPDSCPSYSSNPEEIFQKDQACSDSSESIIKPHSPKE